MLKLAYTMSIDNEAGVEQIVAGGVPLEDALKIAIEHDGTGDVAVVRRDIRTLSCISIGRRIRQDESFECLNFVTVPRSHSSDLDEDYAMRSFEREFLGNTGTFWSGRVETDDEYARRHHEPSEGI